MLLSWVLSNVSVKFVFLCWSWFKYSVLLKALLVAVIL